MRRLPNFRTTQFRVISAGRSGATSLQVSGQSKSHELVLPPAPSAVCNHVSASGGVYVLTGCYMLICNGGGRDNSARPKTTSRRVA